MATIEESLSLYDGLDRICLDLSSKLAEPFCWAYGMLRYRFVSPLDPNKFDNAASKVKEIATRIFIVFGATLAICCAATHIFFAAVAMGIGCKVLRALGVALQKNQYTHVSGTASEKVLEKGEAKVMTWNLCGHCGGLHYVDGGMVHWRSRLNGIVEKIKTENPDILVLQQIYDTSLVESLIEKLGPDYAHFFVHLGINTWGTAGGCMVITKCAVHKFSHTDFENNDYMVNEGFETLELKAHPEDDLPCVRIIGTQILSTDKGKSVQQMAQIIQDLGKEKLVMPTLFVGNIREQGEDLSKYLYHSYRGEGPTQTDEFYNQWTYNLNKTEKTSDFVSLFKRNISDGMVLPVTEKIRLIDCHLVEAFTTPITHRPPPLSNHHAIVTRFDGLKKVGG